MLGNVSLVSLGGGVPVIVAQPGLCMALGYEVALKK